MVGNSAAFVEVGLVKATSFLIGDVSDGVRELLYAAASWLHIPQARC